MIGRDVQQSRMLLTLFFAIVPFVFGCTIDHRTLEALKPEIGLGQGVTVIAKEFPVGLAKKLFKVNISFRHLETMVDLSSSALSLVKETIVFCSNSTSDLEEFQAFIGKHISLALKKPIVIWSKSASINKMKTAILSRLDQRVYYFSTDSGELLEKFTINSHIVSNVLGHIATGTGNDQSPRLKYVPTSKGLLGFEERRGNFHGYHIVAMTNDGSGGAFVDKNFENIAKYHEKNQTYDVTNLTTGPYFRYLTILAKEFNFTYNLYQRKDRTWGSLDIKTGKATGMVLNLADGSAEMIVSSLTLNPWRATLVDYLPVLTAFKFAIGIRREPIEDFSWTMFSNPFTLELWMVLVAVATFLAFCFHFANQDHKKVSF